MYFLTRSASRDLANECVTSRITAVTDGLLYLLCIRKLNADHGACVPPCREFDAENE